MGDNTKIEWTDATWNPIVGCSKVSEGCDHCYAIPVAHRGLAPQHRGLTIRVRNGDRETTEWNGSINVARDEVLTQPLRWKRPRRIFVNSLSDLFHPAVPSHVIRSIWSVMVQAEHHTFQVLTKRPQRMEAWIAANNEVTVPTPPNIWLGVSIESNRWAWRADHLRATPAAVRWVSAEPLLGPLDDLDLTDIDWVVAGGESGPGSRPMHPDWVRDLRDRCVGEDVAFHFKQWGSWTPSNDYSRHGQYVAADPDSPDADHNVRMVRAPKADTGRELDGRTWDEYPPERTVEPRAAREAEQPGENR